MTVIAYKDGIMAADGGEWFGDVAVSFIGRKVHRAADGSLVGCAGKVPQTRAFRRWIDDGEPQPKPFENKEEGDFGAVVVRPDGTIQHYDHTLTMYPAAAPFAVEGCHQEFMLASMLAGMSAIEAVAHAVRYCAYAAGDVFALSLTAGQFQISADAIPEALAHSRATPRSPG